MQGLTLASFIVLVPQIALSSYSPYGTRDLVSQSQLILVGEITKLSNENFTIKIERVVKGQWEGTSIEVLKFADWTCAARYSKYQKGQRAMFFLREHTRKDGKNWHVMGAGNEGEWKLENEMITDKEWNDFYIEPGISTQLYFLKRRWAIWQEQDKAFSYFRQPTRYHKEELIDAVQRFAKCFHTPSSRNADGSLENFRGTAGCSDAELRTFQNKSPAHEMIGDRFLKKSIRTSSSPKKWGVQTGLGLIAYCILSCMGVFLMGRIFWRSDHQRKIRLTPILVLSAMAPASLIAHVLVSEPLIAQVPIPSTLV